MKNFITFIICAVLVFIGFFIILDKEIKCNIEYPEENIIDIVDREIGAITTIDATDKISDSRTTINDNFSYLDTNKISASSTQQTISDKLWIGDNIYLADDKNLYFDTAKSKSIQYSTNHAGILFGFDEFDTVAGFKWYANTAVDGSGNWEPSFEIGEGGEILVSNTSQGSAGNKYFGVNMTDGLKIKTGSVDAIIKSDNIATADKTFQFPNYSGTFAMASSTQQTISGNLWADLIGNADTCTTASAGDAAVDFFGAGVDAVTDATTCTNIEGTNLAITTGTLNWSASEAEIETITGALFGASKAVTTGYVWIADGTDFESVVMGGDITIVANGTTTIGADKVHDSMIDWGAGAGQVSGADITFAEGDMTDSTIISADIKDDTIDSADYAAGSIDAEHLAADVISETKIADNGIDSEHYNDGSIDAVHHAADSITHAYIADADQTDTKCIWFEDPTAADDFKSIWANKTANNFLLTEIWGESDQTVSFDLQIDDGTPADVNGTDISPAAGEAEDTSLSGDTTLAAGEELDLIITSVSGTPTWCSICWTGNWVD